MTLSLEDQKVQLRPTCCAKLASDLLSYSVQYCVSWACQCPLTTRRHTCKGLLGVKKACSLFMVKQGGHCILQGRNTVTLPLRVGHSQAARQVQLEILQRFEYNSKWLLSGVVGRVCGSRPGAAQVFIKGDPLQIVQLVEPDSLPQDWCEVSSLAPPQSQCTVNKPRYLLSGVCLMGPGCMIRQRCRIALV